MAVEYNGTMYYYVTNLQGDIVAVLNTSGTSVVTYTYDAWGNILTTSGTLADSLGTANSLRYRGYVFDSETNLYYLQSRYYDPEMGRFISADAFTSTGQGLLGNNMFAYCRNNPVRRVDISGTADQDCYDTDPLDEEDILKTGQGGGGGDSTYSQAYGPSTAANTAPGLYNFGGAKDIGYANKRGWSNEMIIDTINAGQSGTSTNAATGAECSVYGNPSCYVVVESVSRNLVQLTKIGDDGWIPDGRITWFQGGLHNDFESIHK